jgi:hypothetical protein
MSDLPCWFGMSVYVTAGIVSTNARYRRSASRRCASAVCRSMAAPRTLAAARRASTSSLAHARVASMQSSKPTHPHQPPATEMGTTQMDSMSWRASSARSLSGSDEMGPTMVSPARITAGHRSNPFSVRDEARRVGSAVFDAMPGAHHSARWVRRFSPSGSISFARTYARDTLAASPRRSRTSAAASRQSGASSSRSAANATASRIAPRRSATRALRISRSFLGLFLRSRRVRCGEPLLTVIGLWGTLFSPTEAAGFAIRRGRGGAPA